MKVIIPACGYGIRMGMQPNESKEMLIEEMPHPAMKNYNQPIIQYSLDICEQYNLDPIVITRPHKEDLIEYLHKHRIEVMIHQPKDGEEWALTVLASQRHWEENNLLLLPDTRFHSTGIVLDIEEGLKLGNNAVFALHNVDDPHNWGIIKDYNLIEKPKTLSVGRYWAWGLIAFKDYYGEELFSSKQLTLKDVGFCYLDHFRDITRTK